ncbi:MAG: hypothetical protein MUF37_03180 [Methanoregulaceae archaeon]|jgi:hypothetical protein|nr:hypothetical protein [Methanoregulaceae archaeon]
MSRTTVVIVTGIIIGICLFVHPLAAVHIPTVSEGLLSENGCYAGVYLGGNMGTLGPNNFKNSNLDKHLYETQFLDHPDSFGETVSGGLASIDTGIVSFRASADALNSGSGAKQVIFSRYYLMNFYPDNNYGKIAYTACPGPDVWAEKVIKQGGVPMIALAPYNGHPLSLSDTYPNGKTGSQILTDLTTKLKAVSDRNKDSSGKGATVLIWLAPEFNAYSEVNPESNDNVDSPAKRAFRQWFRDAYTLIHQTGGDNIQVIWAGTVAPTKDARKVYWPGNDNNLQQLPNDSVDWVGMTWYSWSGGPTTLSSIKGFYDFYAKERNHPLIFTETSSDGQGDPVLEESLKISHVTEVYNPGNLASVYPNIKGIIWFNVIKEEGKSGSDPTLVMKNFLVPDGQYLDNGMETPGLIFSGSDPSKTRKMLSLYPDVVMDPYFIPSPGITSPLPTPQYYDRITLSPGWNFVSTPKTLAAGSNTGAIFSNVNMGGHSAFMWDGSLNPPRWVTVLGNTPIKPLYGIWIYSVNDFVVNLTFDTTNPMFIPAPRSLPAGWNTVGFTGMTPVSARNTYLSVQPEWVHSMGFNVLTQEYEPTIFNGDTTESAILYPTRGYWLYMRNPGNLAAIGA